MPKTQTVEISLLSVLRIVFVVLGLVILWQIKSIIALFVVVLFLAAALNPLVEGLMKKNVPRTVAVAMIYVILFALIALFLSLILSPLVKQLFTLVERFPSIIAKITPLYTELVLEGNFEQILQSYTTELAKLTQGVFVAASQIFGGAISAITVFFLSFYILVDARKSRDAVILLTPKTYVEAVVKILGQIGDRIGSWVRAQVLLSFVVGTISYIGLLAMGVPYALTLSILTGIVEIVPVVGPIIAGIATVLVAYGEGSWQLALGVLIFFTVLQQLESALLVPKIMQKAVGLSPVIIILALAIGGQLAGVAGAILAIPITTAIAVLIQEWPKYHRAA